MFIGVASSVILFASVEAEYVATGRVRKPSDDDSIIETIYRYRSQARGPRVVCVGGGTGLPVLLRGLKEHTSNMTAIVTVGDDGGSSGRLRRSLGCYRRVTCATASRRWPRRSR
jgi:hypothetical protein